MAEETSSLVGQLLIAMPSLADPNFRHSVVLLAMHSQSEGAFGIVINRGLDLDFTEVLAQLDQETYIDDLPQILSGGPVEPEHGFVLFERRGDERDDHALFVNDAVMVSGNTETLRRLVEGSIAGPFYLLLGYSGWYPGQLEMEIEENSWLVAPLDTDILFEVPLDERWHAALSSIGIDPGAIVDTGSGAPS